MFTEHTDDLAAWLNDLDQGKGALMQYLAALQSEFGSLAQVAAAANPAPASDSVLEAVDPLIFEAMCVQKIGHKLLIAKGVLALASRIQEPQEDEEHARALEAELSEGSEFEDEIPLPSVPEVRMRGSIASEEPPLAKRPKQPMGPPPGHLLQAAHVTMPKARPQRLGAQAQPPGGAVPLRAGFQPAGAKPHVLKPEVLRPFVAFGQGAAQNGSIPFAAGRGVTPLAKAMPQANASIPLRAVPRATYGRVAGGMRPPGLGDHLLVPPGGAAQTQT